MVDDWMVSMVRLLPDVLLDAFIVVGAVLLLMNNGLLAGFNVCDMLFVVDGTMTSSVLQQIRSYCCDNVVQYVVAFVIYVVTSSKSAHVICTPSLSSSSFFGMVMVALGLRTLCVPLHMWQVSSGWDTLKDDDDEIQPQYSCTGTGIVSNNASMVVFVPPWHSLLLSGTINPIDRSKEPQDVVNNGGKSRFKYNILVVTFVLSSGLSHRKHVRLVISVQPQYSAAEFSGSIVVHDDELPVILLLVVSF